MHRTRTWIGLLLVLVVAVIAGTPVQAAEQLSATRKAIFDELVKEADATSAKAMTTNYNRVLQLQQQKDDWEASAKSVYYVHQEKLSKVNTRLKAYHTSKIEQLEQRLQKTKNGYEPLFALGRTLSTKSSSVSSLKLAIELARQEIRWQQEDVKQAKAERTKMTKTIRAILAEADPIRSRIKGEKSNITATNKKFNAEWKTFGGAVSKKEPKRVQTSLSALVRYGEQMVASKKAIHDYEKQIQAIIDRADRELR